MAITTSVRPYSRVSAPAEDGSLRYYYETELRRIQDTLDDLRRGLTLTQTTYLVANLPAADVSGVGAKTFVTDANATTFASVVAGGGANALPVYSDGTNWRIG
jgi:hypothetical protein